MRSTLVALTLAALAALVAVAPAEESGGPEDLTELLAKIRAGAGVPALGAAVVDADGLVAIGAVGKRVQGKDEDVTRDDLWHLGSCTKALTATLLAELHERGDLPLETTLAKALPRMARSMDARYRDVPLSLLLQNRAGVPGGLTQRFPELWAELRRQDDEPAKTRRLLAQDLLARPPDADPGTAYQYSNAGFAIAGFAAETKLRASWERLLERHVLDPLDMDSAGFGPPGSAKKRDQPFGHRALPAGSWPVPPGPLGDNPRAIAAAGMVHASLADWGRFARLHLRGARGDEDLLLEPETFRMLHEPPEGQAYAMGWITGRRSWARGPDGTGKVLTHDGSNTMWRCSIWIAPERNRAFLVTCNIGGEPGKEACRATIDALIRDHLE